MVVRRPWQNWPRRRLVVLAVVAVLALGASTALAGGLLGVFKPSSPPGPAAVSPSPNTASPSPRPSPSPSPSPTASPSPTPIPPEPLIAISDRVQNTLRLVTLHGAVIATAKAATGGYIGMVAVGGSSAIYMDESPHLTASGQPDPGVYDQTIKALHRDGSIEVLASLGTRLLSGRLVASPDGNEWLWSDFTTTTGTTVHSTIHIGSRSVPDRVLASQDAKEMVLGVYRWDAGGLIAQSVGMGIGGAYPFEYPTWGDGVFLLDPATGNKIGLGPFPTGCRLAARASDGAVACINPSSGTWTINVGTPPRFAVSIPLNRARFALIGGISFKPGNEERLLSVAGCALSTKYGWSNCSTDLVNTKTGEIWRFGPDGLSTADGDWGWLDDGSLVEMTRPGPGDPAAAATYIVSAGGSARFVANGTPVGVIKG